MLREHFFSRYVGHSPGNAPGLRTRDPTAVSSFSGFRARYEEVFGSPLPDLWHDEKSITTRRRVFNDSAGTWILRDDAGMVDLLNTEGDVLMSVNNFGRDALAFVAQTGVFYVRELPGDLSDEEKITLIATLVEFKLLRVAA